MDTTAYEMVDPDVTIRRLGKKLFTLLWLKHDLIATLPPPGPTSPQRINDMSEKIAKSVLVYSYAARPILQYYMEKHSQRIGQSKIAFWTHISFLCLRIRLQKDNLFDYFLNTCSIITEVALFSNWKKLDYVHTYASTYFAAFFESELSGSFYGAGGWPGLMNYIEDEGLLELYEVVEPFRKEMHSPCDLVPIMITVTSEALSAERRERLASSRELKAEEIERFEPVRLLTAKIFNWDFMEQLHISSLKPGVFKRVANIRRKSKGKTVFSDLPKPRSSRQLYIAGDQLLQEAAEKSVFQMKSSPNLRAPEYDTQQRDSKVFHRSVSVNDKPTSSLQASSTLMKKDSKVFHPSVSVDDKQTSSFQASSSWMKEDSKVLHRSVSVDDKPASSLFANSSRRKEDSKVFYRSVSVGDKPTGSLQANSTLMKEDSKVFHSSLSVDDKPTSSFQASSSRMKEDCKVFHPPVLVNDKPASSLHANSSWSKEDSKIFHRSVSVDDKPTSSFLVSSSWLTARQTKYKRPTSKIGVLKDNLNASFKSSSHSNSAVAEASQTINDFPKESSYSETSSENHDNVDELSTNIHSSCCGNEAINLNTAQSVISINSTDIFVSENCFLNDKTKLLVNARNLKYSPDVQISKEIQFEEQTNLSVTDPKPKTLFVPKNDEPHGSTDSKCVSASRIEENDFSTSSSTLSKESISNSESSCNPSCTNISKQSETKHSSNESLERDCKEFTEIKGIDLYPEASAAANSIANETAHPLRYRYQSFDYTADTAESVAIEPNLTVRYKKRLFGTLATRKYSLKPRSVNDIEYLEFLSRKKQFSVNVPEAKQKNLTASETTESENMSLPIKNSNTDEKITKLVKALEKSGVPNPVVFKI